ncbi:hypothetical protein [Marinovum algicola]|uniref:hypothetical protein n=1 Tax=Marinovum algicola TaxID=42444 RepID=UPI0024BB03F9|nr:hypothetical protein [Marinovum algicola]
MTPRPPAFVALGARRYRVAHVPLEGVTDLAITGGRIVVLRRRIPELVELAFDGTILAERDLPDFVCGHGMRALGGAAAGVLAATDMDGHKIALLGPDLHTREQLHCDARPGLGRPFNHPCDCAEGPDGRLYVADGYGNSAVHVFAPDRTHLASFGQPGHGAGDFSTPHSLLFDGQGRLCVADRENNRVQRFDAEGRYLDEIGGLHKPMALALMPDGTLLVTDQTPRLSGYDAAGRLTGRCRTFSTYGHGLAVCEDGTVVIAEMAPDRVTFLRPVAG